MYMNQLTIIGFTGQDAEFHYTPNRTPIGTISSRHHNAKTSDQRMPAKITKSKHDRQTHQDWRPLEDVFHPL
jgi:hypothetical protein